MKNPEGQLCKASGFSFYNISPYDFENVLEDPKNIGKNLRAYMNGFSESLGDKRREISQDQIDSIMKVFNQFADGEHGKIFDTTDWLSCYQSR